MFKWSKSPKELFKSTFSSNDVNSQEPKEATKIGKIGLALLNKFNAILNNKRTRTLVIVVAVSLFMICFTVVVYKMGSASKEGSDAKEVALKESENEYNKWFEESFKAMKSQMFFLQGLYEKIAEAWYKEVEYPKTSTALKDLYEHWNSGNTMNHIKQKKLIIQAYIKKMNSPPKEYEESYKQILVLYNLYIGAYNQVLSPSGSLIYYNADMVKKFSEFDAKAEELEVIKNPIN